MTIEIEPADTTKQPWRPPRRTAAILGATMLVAAAGGVGFGIGRALDDGRSAAGPGAPAQTDGEAATAAPSTGPTDDADEPVGTDGDGTTSEVTSELPADEAVTTSPAQDAPPASASELAVDAPRASGGPGWSLFGDQTMELLAERTTESGLTLRAHRTPSFGDEPYAPEGEDGWRPPPWCSPNAELRIALAGPAQDGTVVIDVGSVSWWDEPYERRAVSWLTLGAVDGNPHRVLVVQPPPSTTLVTAVFDDGPVDTAVPEGGLALLTAPGALASSPETGTAPPSVELRFEGAATDIFRAEATTTWDDPEFRDSCSPPPPALPEPGEQPPDPDAEQAVIDTVAAVYAQGEPGSVEHLIDDPTGVAEARRQVEENGFAEAADSATAVVEELVFTSPTEAVFRYRLETSNGTFDDRFGAAVLVDGTWKLTRETVCLDLGMAGGDCGGPITPPWPPVEVLVPMMEGDVPAATFATGD